MRSAFSLAPLPFGLRAPRSAHCAVRQRQQRLVSGRTRVYACVNDDPATKSPPPPPPVVANNEGKATTASNGEDISTRAARGVWRVGWLAWWVQLVLTAVSVVILLFAFAFPGVTVKSTSSAPGLILSALASVASLASWIWTYVYTRVALRVSRPLSRLVRPLHVGVFLGLVGMVLACLALQATVGMLLARVFAVNASVQSSVQSGLVVQASAVQPIDLLVVQATVNSLCSLFAGLLGTLWLQGRLRVWQRDEAVLKRTAD